MRPLFLLAALLGAVAALAACGKSVSDDSGGEKVSSDTDVNQLLDQTFKGDKKVDSGKVALALKMNIQGSGQVSGPITVDLSGPFQSQGKGKLPKLKLDMAFSGAGQNLKAGVESTGDKGYVNFNGQDYVL